MRFLRALAFVCATWLVGAQAVAQATTTPPEAPSDEAAPPPEAPSEVAAPNAPASLVDASEGRSAGYPLPPPPPAPQLAREELQLRVLEGHLELLAARNQGRVLDGSLRIGLGAVLATVGGVLEEARPLLVTLGAVSVLQGLNTLLLLPDVRREMEAFASAPAGPLPEQRRAKIRLGEAALAEVARRMRRARLVNASLTVAASAAYVPIFWAIQRGQDDHYTFGDSAVDYVLLTMAALGCVAGVVEAVVPSEAERRWSDYRELSHASAGSAPHSSLRRRLRVSAMARSGGALLSAGARF